MFAPFESPAVISLAHSVHTSLHAWRSLGSSLAPMSWDGEANAETSGASAELLATDGIAATARAATHLHDLVWQVQDRGGLLLLLLLLPGLLVSAGGTALPLGSRELGGRRHQRHVAAPIVRRRRCAALLLPRGGALPPFPTSASSSASSCCGSSRSCCCAALLPAAAHHLVVHALCRAGTSRSSAGTPNEGERSERSRPLKQQQEKQQRPPAACPARHRTRPPLSPLPGAPPAAPGARPTSALRRGTPLARRAGRDRAARSSLAPLLDQPGACSEQREEGGSSGRRQLRRTRPATACARSLHTHLSVRAKKASRGVRCRCGCWCGG